MKTSLQMVEKSNPFRLPAFVALPLSIVDRKKINYELDKLKQAGATYDRLNVARKMYEFFNSDGFDRLTKTFLVIIEEEQKSGKFSLDTFISLANMALEKAGYGCEAALYKRGEPPLIWECYTEAMKEEIKKIRNHS